MKDVFHKVCADLSEEDKKSIRDIKDKAEELYELIAQTVLRAPYYPRISISLTKLEECVMWATKSITDKYYE
jgi:hypothetical protein